MINIISLKEKLTTIKYMYRMKVVKKTIFLSTGCVIYSKIFITHCNVGWRRKLLFDYDFR